MRTHSFPTAGFVPLALLGLLAAAAPCLAQGSPARVGAPAQPVRPAFDLGPRTWLVTDEPGDGNVWARGVTYKARCGSDAVELAPAFGARAATNPALSFGAPELYVGGVRVELDELAPPRLGAPTPAEGPTDQQRVWYERGALVERWDLAPRELEHSFVLERPLGAGEIVLRIPLGGELASAGRTSADDASAHASELDSRSLRFAARDERGAELGGIAYSAARTIDADGRVLEHASSLARASDGSAWIELRVDAAFAAAARYPLIVDPIVTIFGVDQSGASSARDPDVAYDGSNQVWLVVWSEVSSGADTDVFARRYDKDGTLREEVGVAVDNKPAAAPSVANNNAANQFLVAWFELGTINDQIRARTRSAASTSQGAVITVENAKQLQEPEVGGTLDSSSGNYLVAYLADFLGLAGTQVVTRTVSTSGALGDVHTFDGSLTGGGGSSLALTKCAGEDKRWALAYLHHNCPPLVCGGELRVQVVNAQGVGVDGPIADFPSIEGTPAISGDGTTFVVVYPKLGADGQSSDIGGSLVRVTGSTVALVDSVASLTQLETPGSASKEQKDVAITSQSGRYTYAYREQVSSGGSVFNHRLATFLATTTLGGLDYVEQHVLAQSSALNDGEIALASTFDGGAAPELVCGVWTRFASSESDVDAFLYDPLGQGGVAVVQTGCGGIFNEPGLLVSGSVLGDATKVTLGTDAGLPIVLLGLPSAPLPLCAGGCSLGVFPILQQFAGSALSLPLPADGALLGQQVALQGVRLNVGGQGGLCGAPQFPVTFRTTDTSVITFE